MRPARAPRPAPRGAVAVVNRLAPHPATRAVIAVAVGVFFAIPLAGLVTALVGLADSLFLIADAIKRANSADPQKIRDALAQTKDFEGSAGSITSVRSLPSAPVMLNAIASTPVNGPNPTAATKISAASTSGPVAVMEAGRFMTVARLLQWSR